MGKEWPGTICGTDEGLRRSFRILGVFTVLEFDILGRLHVTTREANVKGDVVCTFIYCVPLWDLRSWSIIFPSSPQVNLWPFVG